MSLHLKSSSTYFNTEISVASLGACERANLSTNSASDLYTNNRASRRVISSPLTQNVYFINCLSGELFTNYCATVAEGKESDTTRTAPLSSGLGAAAHIKWRGNFTPHTGKSYRGVRCIERK
jgi:hypothetical protein